MNKNICLITGVGPGTGSALVRRFSQKYRVAMLARTQDRLTNLENELEAVKGYVCDVSDSQALEATLDLVKRELGAPSVLVHNAVGGAFGSFLEIDPSVLENNFQVNTMALLHLGRSLAPDMISNGEGAIIITGNTSAFRGMAGFAGFAPTKAAQRVLAESMARDLGPKGVHVGYVAIDAVIDLEWTRKRMPDKSDDYFCKPDDIAEECYRIAHQSKSAWSFNSIIRPFGENWSVS